MQSVLLAKEQTQYGLIEVREDSSQRWLVIDGIEQSRININHPETLALAVHEAIMAFRFFTPLPKKILLAGVGGGGLASYFYALDSKIKGDAVELNPFVVDAAKRYFNFPQTNWRLITQDIRDWKGSGYDLAIVDLAYLDSTPKWLCNMDTLQQFKSQLCSDGLLAINLLANDAEQFTHMLANIRKVFSKRTVCLSVAGYKNIIVFAFNSPITKFDVDGLAKKAQQLTKQTAKEIAKETSNQTTIDFQSLLTQLKKDNPVGSGVF